MAKTVKQNGILAQLGEHLPYKQRVIGSSPIGPILMPKAEELHLSLIHIFSILGALALREAYPDLPMRIDLIGTPGEEFVGGKCYMTGNGGFDGYEYAAMVHLNNENVT